MPESEYDRRLRDLNREENPGKGRRYVMLVLILLVAVIVVDAVFILGPGLFAKQAGDANANANNQGAQAASSGNQPPAFPSGQVGSNADPFS